MNNIRKYHTFFIFLLCLLFVNGFSDPSSAETTGTATALYDPCQATRQLFTINLSSPIVIPAGTILPYGTGNSTVAVSEYKNSLYNFWFLVRKCNDNLCESLSFTYATPYSITSIEGKTYFYSGLPHEDTIKGTVIKMVPFGTNTNPFGITSLRLIVTEPGTYAVYTFAPYSSCYQTVPTNYYEKLVITINKRDDFLTCVSSTNDGYFHAYLEEIDTSSYPSTLKFEHIEEQEKTWIENRSKQSLVYSFDNEWSYLHKGIDITDLNCYFEALNSFGQPENGQCNSDNIFLPPYTRVTITGGSLSIYEYPLPEEKYKIAYTRREIDDTANLFISVEESRRSKVSYEEPVVYALPEDEIGAYMEGPDGVREYLIFQTYDICMQYLGSDDLCSSNQHCYHK